MKKLFKIFNDFNNKPRTPDEHLQITLRILAIVNILNAFILAIWTLLQLL